jgi:hypothetical protein
VLWLEVLELGKFGRPWALIRLSQNLATKAERAWHSSMKDSAVPVDTRVGNVRNTGAELVLPLGS